MRAFIDQIEGAKARLRLGEDEALALTLPLSELPKGVKEGDVLTLTFKKDAVAAAADTQRTSAKRDALLEQSKGEAF